MFEAGTAKADITPFAKGVGMMGYGMYHQKVEEIETPLTSRCTVFKDSESGKKFAFVNAEICFITIAIKQAVIKKLPPGLGFDDHNVMLTAQHTHSGPGGYSHYAFFNMSIPGFVPEVFNKIVDGITESIVKADRARTPAKIYFGKGVFAPEIEVAFNRSLPAYNANPEVKKLKEKDWHLALDREMTLLKINGEDDSRIGMINWFGVHTTTVGNDMKKICYDNKGYASAFFENNFHELNGDFTAVFAQGPCGDVMPNFIMEKKRNKMRGKYKDDFESASYNGRLQYEKAKEIYDTLGMEAQGIRTGIDYGLMYVDFSNVLIDTEFVPDSHPDKDKELRTGPSCMGVAFFKGTVDGKGISDSFANLASSLSKAMKFSELCRANFLPENEKKKIIHKYKTQGKKDILIETCEKKVLGISNINKLAPLTLIDETLGILKKQYSNGSLNNNPWTPQVLPLQVFILGELAIIGIPAEVSVVSGRRFKKTLENILKERGVTEIILSPYANAYSGYITTYEEYQLQRYEAGHTVFGEWTQPAYQTKLKQMALEMLKESGERNFDPAAQPEVFDEEDLKKRSFPTPVTFSEYA